MPVAVTAAGRVVSRLESVAYIALTRALRWSQSPDATFQRTRTASWKWPPSTCFL
jgi:hypothetical protein